MRKKFNTSKTPTETSSHYSWGKLVKWHLCPYRTARKDMLISHQKYTLRVLLIEPLVRENLKMELNLNSQLRKSISRKSHATLNQKSQIKNQLGLINVCDKKTLLIQSRINNFSTTFRNTKIMITHLLNFHNKTANHGIMING